MDAPSPEHPAAIIARILERRERAGEDHLETFPETPAEVIAWIIAHPDVPAAVAREDVLDCFRLDYYLQKILDKRRLALYRLARSPGVEAPWREIAAAQHLESPQGAVNAERRLRAQQEEGKRTEKALRDKRRKELTEETWAEARAIDIRKAAVALIGAAPDGAPDIAEIAETATPRTLMSWIVSELYGEEPGMCPPAEALVAEWHSLPRPT